MSTLSSKVVSFLEASKGFLRDPYEPNRLFAKGCKIEGVYLIVSKGIPLFRTEGVGDVTLLTVKEADQEYTVPAILPEKIQAKIRRQMLEILRGNVADDLKQVIKKYRNLGFKKVEEDGSWNCYIAPPLSEGGTDIGMCGFCPSCTILGSMITDVELEDAGTSYGLKSRVQHDIAFAATVYERAVSDLTHTKVGDGISYTGMALFEEPHILPGVCFIGKIVLSDVTMREAKIVLSSLTSIARMGAGEAKYGSVQVILLGLKTGRYESISSYDIVRHVLSETKGAYVTPEEVLKHTIDYVGGKGFNLLFTSDINVSDIESNVDLSTEDVKAIWSEDNYSYAKQILEYVRKVHPARAKRAQTKGAPEEG